MKAKLLEGTYSAQRILKELKGSSGKLVVVQVGKNAVSQTYITEKAKAAKEIGVEFQLINLQATIEQKALEQFVRKLGNDSAIHGILVQLPLPKHIQTQEVLNAIPVAKDVDVLSSYAFGLFALQQLSILPPTVGAISYLLRATRVKLKGKHAVVVGAGRLVGLPTAIWLSQQGATVSLAHKHTKKLKDLTMQADIVISATGKQGLITPAFVKKGAIVIDAGTSVEQGKTKGDVQKSVATKAAYLSPVPGGVGPLTVACLLQNVITLTKTTKSNAT